ncbi:hypothetical protein Acy02nite_62740 [Actinoplanes cyaneus]|uniref:Uncharacterized protein n=1 Tax=Actinoplanes cyaneus TaxID=52696 RepID=A0A919M8H1_9ACTN|nr:hypothetical protein [Actinoplanes cyaneus]MCW2141527.1 hypothetical protein [Actinoplanes cyaneus]GID68393.1 hypothetical protein Acy02nite_62740 [Actinoplanes cyaneus]
MNLRKKIGASVGTAVLVTGAGTMLGATPAAAAHRCGSEFIGIPSDQNADTTLRETVVWPGVAITLKIKQFQRGVERVFARIQGQTRQGDQVWLDWSYTGGNGWAQCGPFTVSADHRTNTSGAALRHPDGRTLTFRACMNVHDAGVVCTDWWT